MTGEVSKRQMLFRLAAIVAIAGTEIARTLPAALFAGSRSAARRRLYAGLVRAVQALGPTFVKFGQTTATRPDAVSPELCAELERLYDAVAPMTRAEVERALASARAARPALAAAAVDLDPVGTGSVACVYRATLPGGEEIALKLKRPDVDRRMACDLALIAAMARAGQRLPKLRGMPIADLFEYISAAIVGQLDFEREARHSELIRRVLAPIPDVVVPRLHPELSGPDCLVFEYLPGLDADTPDALPEPARERLGSIVMTAVHKLFFEDGLVHCDLHPGNLYVTRDQQVVILDAGYCVRLPDRVRRLIGEFFARLAIGDGRRCGEIVLESAVNADASTDAEGFVAEFASLVARAAGPGNMFDMPSFGDAMYELQQRFGIYAASDFAFPLMSLMVVEGTLHRVWPGVDFQAVGGARVSA